jgi:hypothetical protein
MDFGKQFDDSVNRIASKIGRPELRRELKRIMDEWVDLHLTVKNAKDLEEFESILDRKDKLLTERIHQVSRMLYALAEIKAAEDKLSKKQYDYLKLQATDKPEEIDDILSEMGEKPIMGEITSILDGISNDLENLARSMMWIRRKSIRNLTKNLTRFKWRRRWRKMLQFMYRFVLAVLVFGLLYSQISSQTTKLLSYLKANWIWIILFALLAVILKEYKISPWLRSKRLELQRKHLLSSLREFYAAYFNTTSLIAFHEEKTLSSKKKGVRLKKRRRGIKTAHRIDISPDQSA